MSTTDKPQKEQIYLLHHRRLRETLVHKATRSSRDLESMSFLDGDKCEDVYLPLLTDLQLQV